MTLTSDSQHPTILDCIGATPLVELRRLASRAGMPEGVRIFAKLESINPGGSCKDRIALALLADAEAKGLQPGGVVVEATSGNTGIALAQACAVKGYQLHIVCSEKVSNEKEKIVQAFGATVHRTPNVPHGHRDHYTEVAPRLARELGGFYLDQFHNKANTRVHETSTAPELLRQAQALGITVDVFVAGVGTGGTLTGIARHFAQASPRTRFVLADPEGSVLAGSPVSHPYKVEGIGDDAQPPLYEAGRVPQAVTVSDRTAFRTALDAARHEGLLVGGSAGAHIAAAIEVAKRSPAGTHVVTVIPDTGRNYLSTFFDPAWCGRNGLADLHPRAVEVLA